VTRESSFGSTFSKVFMALNIFGLQYTRKYASTYVAFSKNWLERSDLRDNHYILLVRFLASSTALKSTLFLLLDRYSCSAKGR
jgi:hypothetical protein